ncbi:MAG: hypothetical protein AAB664_03115, partial [Patescibacteria group bacterium]
PENEPAVETIETSEIPVEVVAKEKQEEGEKPFDPTPEQWREIREKQKILSSLAYFIGKDFSIPIELNKPGAGWHWDMTHNIIRIDPKDLLEKPMDFLRFVISHEGGHRRISRATFIPLEIWQQPGFSFMMNAIEDPRDNNFVRDSYPRFGEQMEIAYAQEIDFEGKSVEISKKKLGTTPRFLQAGFEYIKQWFHETQGLPVELSKDLPDDVRRVVELTLDSARESWSRYPTKDEADGKKSVVSPEGKTITGEALIEAYARVSYEINHEEVWPEFQKLVEKDLEDQMLQELLKEMQKDQTEKQEDSSEEKDNSTEQKKSIPEKLKKKLTEDQEKELMDALDKAIKKTESEGKLEDVSDDAPKEKKGEPVDMDSLSKELKQKIKDYLDSLSKEKQDTLGEASKKMLKELEDEINKALAVKLSDDPTKKAEREANGEPEP